MEIGVFYGRSFALMAKFLDPSKEVAIACDLFDIDGITNDDSLQLRSFKSVLKHERIHESSVWIIKLKPEEFLNMARPARKFQPGRHDQMAHLYLKEAVALLSERPSTHPNSVTTDWPTFDMSSGPTREN